LIDDHTTPRRAEAGDVRKGIEDSKPASGRESINYPVQVLASSRHCAEKISLGIGNQTSTDTSAIDVVAVKDVEGSEPSIDTVARSVISYVNRRPPW
jgi:hypothetical protein